MEFLFDDKKVYYEIYGEGKPLFVLNGIMMSHLSWKPFLSEMTKHSKVILFDFLDQGASAKLPDEVYTHDIQVALLHKLIEHLEFKTVDLLGISYGAQIALQYAISYPDMVSKLLIFNAASYTTPWLRDIGRAWIGAAKTYDPMHFFHVTIPYIYSNTFYTNNIKWIEERKELLKLVFDRKFLDAMIRLIKSSEIFDVRDSLSKITANTLVVGSDCDYITPPDETKKLASGISEAKYFELQECGHASMYERANEFMTLVNGFITTSQSLKIV